MLAVSTFLYINTIMQTNTSKHLQKC
ncbi:hypothetical protein ACEQPO_20100 [Bacillus sp. SL00103]